MSCTPPPHGRPPSSQSPSSRGMHGARLRTAHTIAFCTHARRRVVINDIVDIEFKAIVAALELIADALHFLGLSFIPTFSLSQIAKGFEVRPTAATKKWADIPRAGPDSQPGRHCRGSRARCHMRALGRRSRDVRLCHKAGPQRCRVPDTAIFVPHHHRTGDQRPRFSDVRSKPQQNRVVRMRQHTLSVRKRRPVPRRKLGLHLSRGAPLSHSRVCVC